MCSESGDDQASSADTPAKCTSSNICWGCTIKTRVRVCGVECRPNTEADQTSQQLLSQIWSSATTSAGPIPLPAHLSSLLQDSSYAHSLLPYLSSSSLVFKVRVQFQETIFSVTSSHLLKRHQHSTASFLELLPFGMPSQWTFNTPPHSPCSKNNCECTLKFKNFCSLLSLFFCIPNHCDRNAAR